VSATGSLVVRRKTQIQTEPLDVMIHEGTEAKFTCTATTDPEEVSNLSIEWKKDGQLIDYALAQHVFRNDMDNSLTISGTISLDTGKYTCMATNGLDSGEASAQLVVQGKHTLIL
jgi:receptor-type tyrosine-protein phosphatase zeta